MAHVFIGIPSRTKGYWGMFQSLLGAVLYSQQNGVSALVYPLVGCSLICRARQDLTATFLNEYPEATHFLQLDDDVQIPPNTLLKLLAADKPIISGLYSHKNKAGYLPIRAKKKFKITECEPNEIKEVQYVPTGCLMQTREVVQKMWDSYPDLHYKTTVVPYAPLAEDKRPRAALYQPYIYKDEYLSEDFAYCQRLQDIGEKIYAHTGVRCVHHGLASYGIQS